MSFLSSILNFFWPEPRYRLEAPPRKIYKAYKPYSYTPVRTPVSTFPKKKKKLRRHI